MTIRLVSHLRPRLLAYSLMSWLCLTAFVLAEDAKDKKGIEFFEKRIRPILADHCYECHGADERKSGLRLDSWEGMDEGGDTGEVLISDDAETSLLMAVLNYEVDDLQMPPDGKLEDKQIADVLRWLKMGAPHPDRSDNAPSDPQPSDPDELKTDHWSFQTVAEVAPPEVRNRDRVRTPIDAFILRQLESKQLGQVARADRAALIRRATLDLWGLPPTPLEVSAFVKDDAPDAFSRLIDRLLASPRYGERWGRHWLDVARYADSNGLDENIAHGNAWRYRDYVVAAWNRDKPFNEFIEEQIAGDRLPAASETERHEHLVATGFLSLGPKVLAEGDLQKMEMDIIDEQIDTLGRAFMGMTLGCARCHDHKFDPISTQDYYALAGVFKSTQTMENFNRIARWYEHSLVDEATIRESERQDEAIRNAKAELTAAIASADKTLNEADRKLDPKKREAKYPADTAKQIKTLRDAIAEAEAKRTEFPTAMGVTEGTPTDLRVHIRGSHLSLGGLAKRRFPKVLAGGEQKDWPSDRSGRLRLARWLSDNKHPLTSRVIVNRVWRWHFGRGLSVTTDNFGRLGEPPTHPQLLDWLTADFVANGWSLKHLHRQIMLSSTYQLASSQSAASAKKDPENRFYWRFEPRRMEAEAIRDAMLFVSGRLDETMGGSLLHVKNREFFFNHLSKDTTNYDSQRRSLYLPIVRNNLYDVFTLFDYSDASMMTGDRTSTTVAPQALFMLNSDLVLDSAASLARRIIRERPTDTERVDLLFQILLARLPTAAERETMLQFVASAAADSEPSIEAWSLAAQIGLATNEFIYLR